MSDQIPADPDIAEFIAACERAKASLRKAIDACNRAVAEIEGGASMPRHRPFGTACSDCKGTGLGPLVIKRHHAAREGDTFAQCDRCNGTGRLFGETGEGR